ncbi:pantoate--beta-alanine ligase [Rossellomorea marisflavi]
MRCIENINDLTGVLKNKRKGSGIGFVPTMGYLHEGHLSLVKKAREENDLVVMSIYVNPTQFGPGEDFDRYPRDLERDKALAEEAGVDVLFLPRTEEIYAGTPSVTLHVTEGVDVMCGKKRPGHFDGVVTILTKLFHIVQPDSVYMGLKDAQQVAVVEGLVKDFFFPVTIVRVPTMRESDGLAKSSRNVYLSPKEREEAPVLHHSLQLARKAIQQGADSSEEVISLVHETIESGTSGVIDYIDVLSYPGLCPVQVWDGEIIVALAVQYERARLIDNTIITVSKEDKHV